MRLIAIALLLSGCGLLSEAAAPVVMNAVEAAADKLLEATGKELDDVPHSCTTENHPESGELLLLCTFCYGDLPPGETCD